MWKRWIFAILGICVLFLLIAALVIVRIGPTADGPGEDPVAKRNQARAKLADNADHYYIDAAETIKTDAPEGWETDFDPRIVELDDVAAWVDSREEAVDLIRRGAQCECRLELAWNGPMWEYTSNPSFFRTLTRFLVHRARLAELRGDVARYGDSIVLADAVGRHAMQEQTVIGHLIGVACQVLMYEDDLRPYGWKSADAAALAAYARQVSALDRPLPSFRPAVEFERDSMDWTMSAMVASSGWKRLILPPNRLYGEMDRAFAPAMELAGESLGKRLDVSNPLHARLGALEAEQPSFLNPARMLARVLVPSLARALELDARARMMQRGSQTVRAVFEKAGPQRQFPDSLDFLGDSEFAIDGYTGKRFIYRRTADGFILYSAGIDRDDDGGAHNARFGEQRSTPNGPPKPPDGDYVFWPLTQRVTAEKR